MDDDQINHRLDRLEDKVDRIDDKVDGLDKDLSRYRGLVGGVLLALTAVGTFLKIVWDWAKGQISWQ